MIVYKEEKDIEIDDLLALYSDAEWLAYTSNPKNLYNSVLNSDYVLSAWEDDKLIGLIRTISDKHTIVYVQDILVLKSYKRRGIGKHLMHKMNEKYAELRQKVLLTEDSDETRGFYEAIGFKSCDDGNLVAFAIQ